MPQPDDSAPFWKREFRLDLRPLVRWGREHPESTIVILGVAVRLIEYWWNRAMWLDEMSLQGNVVEIGILDFTRPLWNDQLAPMGFLILERAMATFLSARNHALRSLPLAAALGALLLFRRVATGVLPGRAALVALALFAFSDDLVYYAVEFKPYALDLLFGLAITLQALNVLGRTPSPRDVARMVLLLAASPWFSFSSAFVVVGCGLVLLGDALASRRFRVASLWLAMGVGWLANFYVSYRASQAMLNPYTTMFFFWDFAFLPPTRGGLLKSIELLLEIFVNPLNLLTVPGYRAGVVVPLFLLGVGAASMARRAPRIFLLLNAPIALALGAAVARRYPFHGRLILELVPALFLMIAEGTEWVARRFPDRRGIAYRATLILLLAYPCWETFVNMAGRPIREFNIHGDLHRNVFIDRDLKR